MSKIYLASDHGGFALKQSLIAHLGQGGFEVEDLGPSTADRVDYPDFGARLAQALGQDPQARGILVCGSGIGISIAANRFAHVRAANCTDVTMARLSRQHNDANVLALGERLLGVEVALEIVDVFLSTGFDGGRHAGRVKKLTQLP